MAVGAETHTVRGWQLKRRRRVPHTADSLRGPAETRPTAFIRGGLSQGLPRGRWWEAPRQCPAGRTEPQVSASTDRRRERRPCVVISTAKALRPRIPLLLHSRSEPQTAAHGHLWE